MSLRDSEDPVVREVIPDVKTGRKWVAAREVEEMESRLRHKDIVGYTQTGHAGLGMVNFNYFSKASSAERRAMVVKEVRAKEEEARQAKAAGMALQGGWTQWESIEPRSLSWSEIWTMERMLSRFLIKSTSVMERSIQVYN